ncbi:MAG: metallophosphoesterase [Myxococcales bacterium]|nr:metallophosphoesterase [Myxococcales bacterium]
MRVLHCSDVHLTQDYFSTPLRQLGWRRSIALLELKLGGRAAAYAAAADSLRRIVADLERHRAGHLVVSGDLTAYAMESEFQLARDALSPVAENPGRCTVIPGNHDFYTPRARADRLFERAFGHLLESDFPEYASEGPYPFVRLLGEEAAVVGLCSARVPPFPGLSYGFIGKRQLESLRRLVEDPRLRQRAILVAVHHAPRSRSGGRDRALHGLLDAGELLKALPGPRFAVLHGHIHHRYHHDADESRPHLFGAGSSTQAGREGYWLIEVRDGKVAGGTEHAPGE